MNNDMMRNAAACALAMFAAIWMAPNAEAEVPRPVEALFPLDAVRLDGGPLKAQQEQNRKYLLRLDPDRRRSRIRDGRIRRSRRSVG